MEIIPAIDIKDGKCVRLYQGNYDKEIVYLDSPIEAAFRWVREGADRLHIVDLDGALAGKPIQMGIVEEIVSATSVSIQLGGGIREITTAKHVASKHVERVVIGTAAVEHPTLVEDLIYELGSESVIVSVDARDNDVVLRGWTKDSGIPASELIHRVESKGVRRIIYTDVTRDGTLTEPNFQSIGELVLETSVNILVAGGVSSIEHLHRLENIGVEGAIIGKAMYTGDIDLRKAIESIQKL